MSHAIQDVIGAFANGSPKPARASNVFQEGGILYSYGHHFPLAWACGGLWFVNGDKYSITTSLHQRLIQNALPSKQTATISLSAVHRALASLGLSPRWPRNYGYEVSVVDFLPDGWGDIPQTQPPMGATLRYRKDDRGQSYAYAWHRPATVVLAVGDAHLLCSMDEGSYFVSRLPRPVSSIEDAYQALMPEEAQGREDYIRQGEWFFMPVEPDSLIAPDTAKAVKRAVTSKFVLPRPSDNSNPHTATRGLTSTATGAIYVMGRIRHPEHRMVKLEKGVIYQAYRNTSLGDWSASGKVD